MKLIDGLKGILMLMVVMGHIVEGVPFPLSPEGEFSARGLIYFFHMPLFFFVSGSVGRDSVEKHRSKALKFIKIFLTVTFIHWLLLGQKFKHLILQPLIPYNHLWYMEVLAIYFLGLSFIKVDFKKLLLPILVISFIMTASRDVAVIKMFIKSGYKVWGRGLEYFAYFFLGRMLIPLKFKLSWPKISGLVVIAAFGVILATIDQRSPMVDGFGFRWIYAAGVMITSVSLSFLVKYAIDFVPQLNFPIFNYFGKHSLLVYLWHYVPCEIYTKKLVPYWGLSTAWYMGIIPALIIIISLCLIEDLVGKLNFGFLEYLGVKRKAPDGA